MTFKLQLANNFQYMTVRNSDLPYNTMEENSYYMI